MPTFTNDIQHCTESASQSNYTRNRNKRNSNWKGRIVTISFHRLYDHIYEKSKDSTRKLLTLVNKSSKAAGYKINTQDSAVSIHAQ